MTTHPVPGPSPLGEARARQAELDALRWQAGYMAAELALLRAEHIRLTGITPPPAPCARCGNPVEAPAAICRDGCAPRVITTRTNA